MPIEPPYYPIVYVRGFAASMGEIEEAAATPYMGFNDGATKIRQKHDGEIVRFIFESPLIRLIKDHGYNDTFRNGDELAEGVECPPRCVWIFRYYERASQDLGQGKRQTIPEIAQDLRRFILKVRDRVCGEDKTERKKFRVHLVAHSMGGLVCRCYLQSLCANGAGSPSLNKELEIKPRPSNSRKPVSEAVHLVEKVFTYATPHNGIDLLDHNVPDLGILDGFHVRNFNRDVMREYLNLPKGRARSGDDDEDAVNSLNGAFPTERFFCLVGSNHNDYSAFFKLSRRATGPMSDGLVMIRNASVKGAARAFVHRSHSGHYGIVNSEEGYQNLRRFLFGDLRVEALLFADQITLPHPVEYKRTVEGKTVKASYHIDTTAQVRGGRYFLHERRFDQSSAILRSYESMVQDRQPVYLFTGYLMEQARTTRPEEGRGSELAFAIRVGIRVPMYEIDNKLWFDHHFEGGPVFDETITFHLEPRESAAPVRYGLSSRAGVGEVQSTTAMTTFDDGSRGIEIPLGFAQGEPNPPTPGFRGRLRLVISPWNR